MDVSRRVRGTRVAGAAGLVVVAVGSVVACDPAGLSSATVAYTTDQTATRELERQHVDVRWLTCTADYGNRVSSPSATEDTVATVDCRGQTGDGKDITVKGKVTRAVQGACVRGDLTATVGGKELFHVRGLGNCNATPSPVRPPGNGPQPTVTVTVTRTIWCQGDPTCWPVQGK
ncbi:hypothetical protein C3489_30545 [Streptomyces sp. Ru71]|uniref:hypothetical protein n=1 Tax=Streptomyces sp. Ru71 TaxID=2080746 RepID=UPI000CDDE7E6|nr:hypothetical protein [Streptomyces sp. Ru71]POX47065.1 hypothetical protein C3489_30545 [Streptomyces sp. Ru71]